MKECDILRGSKHTPTPPTYFRPANPLRYLRPYALPAMVSTRTRSIDVGEENTGDRQWNAQVYHPPRMFFDPGRRTAVRHDVRVRAPVHI